MKKMISDIVEGIVASIAIIVTLAFVFFIITSPIWFVLFLVKLLK